MHRSTLTFTSLLGTVSGLQCTTFNTNVKVTAPSYQPAFPEFANHYQSVAFLNDLSARNASPTASPFKPIVNVTETFSYGSPVDVQVLTHGLGFDKSYWNLGGENSTYSYIRAATGAGYATLSYDRIGNGGSSVPDPYTVQQAQIELAVLEVLTTNLRKGTLDSCVPKPSSVYHVGHSYGSILSHALVASAPTLSDGIILTGYSTNLTWQGQFLISTNFHLAREDQPQRFGNRGTGSLTTGDELADQYIFFAYSYFDPAVLAYADANKYPFSIGELLTGGVLPYNANAFTGPVLVISGDADLIFCGRDCSGTLEQAAPFFPAAQTF